ncbi:hypothetical protein [Alkaliphilus sp. B6464]|nr:hypothetical protein [Alkaliphilus sp. B6464]QUH19470.1 hypothetical protein HYG84_05930 [Alkaliphilus sp. B6464]
MNLKQQTDNFVARVPEYVVIVFDKAYRTANEARSNHWTRLPMEAG